MAFEVLNQQVRALTSVAGSLTGQVASFHGNLLHAQVGSPLLAGQMMFSDALRLLAIIELLPDMSSYEFEVHVGTSSDLDFRELERMLTQLEKTASELKLIEDVIRGLEMAISQMNTLLGQLNMTTDQLHNISRVFSAQATTVQSTMEKLNLNIIPTLHAFRDTLTGLLSRYREEANLRSYYLFINSRRYKPFLPLAHAMKLKRQKGDVQPEVLLKLAHLVTSFSKWKKMHQLLLKYIDLKGGRPEDYLSAISVPLNRNKHEYVKKLVDEGMKAHPEDLSIPQSLADLLASRGRSEEEAELWEAWVANHPKPAKARKEVKAHQSTRTS